MLALVRCTRLHSGTNRCMMRHLLLGYAALPASRRRRLRLATTLATTGEAPRPKEPDKTPPAAAQSIPTRRALPSSHSNSGFTEPPGVAQRDVPVSRLRRLARPGACLRPGGPPVSVGILIAAR